MTNANSSNPTNHDPLHAAIEDAIRRLEPATIATLGEVDSDAAWEATHRRLTAQIEVSKVSGDVDNLIQGDLQIPAGGQYMIRLDSGSMGFSYQLGEKLVSEAIQRGSAGEAIAWIRRVFNAKKGHGKIISPVWGISTKEPIVFSNGVRLIPLADIQDGPQMKWLRNARSTDSVISSMLHFEEITSALVMDITVDCPVYLEQPGPQDEREKKRAARKQLDAFTEIEDAFNDVADALTIAGCPRVVIPVCRWFAYDDPDLECALGGGHRRSKLHELLPLRMPAHAHYEVSSAIDSVNGFLSLANGAKNTVRIALQRLKRSLGRHRLGDAAVELSIALEALLGDNQTSEMTHKVTVRAVRLLGGDIAQRKRNYAMFKKAYSIRSGLVHRGEEPDEDVTLGEERIKSSKLIEEVSIGCAELIRRVIRRGGMPNWTEFDYTEHLETP